MIFSILASSYAILVAKIYRCAYILGAT